MTKSDFPENIKYISEIGYENGIDHFLVKNTDERIEGLEMYSVGIDKEYGLSVVDILFYINNDMGGNKATEKYNILKNVLVSKYGEQYSDEYIWRNHKKKFNIIF
ncbi:hypothetical protein AYY17_19425 [Morganella psychrotolerans]|uniref:Uncharacterized protein n=2 Tax=Morganella psychrotolerans TaxID=368603 RepID=A0A1B8HDB2_9GAMM|nr:hypothetical protein AYY17_19425 [Morganella psychrotolerans]